MESTFNKKGKQMTNKILVSFILDETGSMESVKQQTISGFNEYIDTLKKEKTSKNVLFTLTKFNSEAVNIVCDGIKLDDVIRLDNFNYHPNCLTPLYDAIGKTIHSLENKIKGKKQSALVVIQTDGEENASKEFTRESIFNLIDEKKKLGWTFAFLGADQDAWVTSQSLGIAKGNTVSYTSSNTRGTIAMAASSTARYITNNGIQADDYFSNADDDKLKPLTK